MARRQAGGQGVGDPSTKLRHRVGEGRERFGVDQAPLPAFASKLDRADLLGAEHADDKDLSAASAGRVVGAYPFQLGQRQGNAELLLEFAQAARDGRLIPFSPATGQVPQTRKPQVWTDVALIDQQPSFVEQGQLGSVENPRWNNATSLPSNHDAER